MSLDPHDLLLLLRHMCHRPAMYVRRGSFDEVVAYLNGYEAGANPVSVHERELNQFGYWLQHRREPSRAVGWSTVLLAHCDGDEQLALERLPLLFAEYLGIAEDGSPS